MSRTFALAGLGMFGAGALKLRQHMASADPFAAYWCRTPGADGALGGAGGEWLALGHCWGCYAMAIGAAMLGLAAWRALQSPRRPAAIRLFRPWSRF